MCTHTISSPSSRWLAGGLGLLLVVALAAGLLPGTASAASPADTNCSSTYEVARGDTLATIGSKFGRTASQIVGANDNWKKPYVIYVGQRVCIPKKAETGTPKVDTKSANASAVYFGAARDKNTFDLLVYTYNYPDTIVLVKVDNATDSVKKFYEAGKIDIGAVGNQRAWRFKLPADLKSAKQIQICLKDMTTDHLQCVYPRTGP